MHPRSIAGKVWAFIGSPHDGVFWRLGHESRNMGPIIDIRANHFSQYTSSTHGQDRLCWVSLPRRAPSGVTTDEVKPGQTGGCRRSPNGSPQSQAITRTTCMAVAVRSCWRCVRAKPTSRLRRRSTRRIPGDRLLSTPARSASWGFLPNPHKVYFGACASAAPRRRTAVAPLALEGPAIERRVRSLQPVDRDVAAIDPMGSRRGQKDDDVGHLLGRAEPAHRKAVPHV